ncbi:N-6 DNA methylase [Bodo saltans virus]|uniref:site-specific DNA-methyltransferase (adenine-specific) n=1 Tax=Bodo saltans virus TaxID=2024608 RepID=A0A2H4UVB0_9VIRU|nr:N-6 DNA methylase [Bodo saltans virus]ATZ80851.1 N-6 DNA methylase [Bodo saltans virus]
MSNIRKMSKSLESVVNYIRNVLRKEGITGMDSINHCIAFIICRTLDDDICKQLDIDDKYSYEKMMKDDTKEKKIKEIGNHDLFARFYSGDKNSFIGQLSTKLGFKNIKFKLQGAENLKDIMKKLQDFDPKHVESKYDIIGTIYEIHLKSGTSNAMRDLGQYYTHRLVIDYMIKLCDPKMEKNKIEKIVDPTMGTGGFLTMAIKYLNEKYKDKIDWEKNKNNIIGFDIDENVRNMAMLNIFLETGKLCDETICKQDTLHNDMLFEDGTILQKAKIILANEPMGLKNIIFSSCCERIRKNLKAGTKAEPLFLKLFMETLDDGGRCAVIIPDGTLFGDSVLHLFVRKHMVENFNLKKIISLNDDFFLNTGVKTSILFFVKDGTTTKEVEFSELKLKNDGVEENKIITAKYDDIKKNNYTLFVNKYNIKIIDKIQEINYKKLGEIITSNNGGEVIPKEYWNTGSDILYTCCQNFMTTNFSKFPKNKLTEDGDILLPRNGSGTPYAKYPLIGSMYSNVVQRIKIDNNICVPKYVYYVININIQQIIDKVNIGTIPSYNFDLWKNFELPIPHINIQRQIVDSLDILNSNNETCKKYIEESNFILKKYIELNSKGTIKKIGDICDIKSGKFNSQDKKEIGKYPFYTSEVNSPCGFSDDFCFDYKEYLILIKDGGAGQGKYGDQIGLGKVFKIKGKSCATSHQYAVIIKDDCKEILNDYLYLFLMTKKNQIMDLAMYTTGLGCIRKGDFDDLNIEYPSVEKQKEIICFCDEMISNIEYTKKQINNNTELMKKIIESLLLDNKKEDIDDEKDDEKVKNIKEKKIAKKVVKKEESESESNSPDSESEKDVKTKNIKEKKKTKKSSKKEESKSESNSSESSSEDEKIIKQNSKTKK